MAKPRLFGASTRALLILSLATTSLVGCNLEEVLPSKPSDPRPTATPNSNPVAIPVVLGAPAAPSPTPAATPTPGPAPTPEPSSPPPTSGSCSLPNSSTPDAPCSMQSPNFLGAVDKAITQLTQQQPGIFDMNLKTCENCYYVKNEAAFVAGVIKNLNAAGYCAFYDGEELAVKNSNSFNEQYDILVSSGYIRRGGGSYRSTCNPSWF